MAKTGVTYTQVATACQDLLREGQNIKLRSITAITGGSPNKVLQHWQQWQQEQGEATLKQLEEDLSSEVKQAIRAECARKMRVIKEEYNSFRTSTVQQMIDMQSQLDETLKKKEDLRLDISVAKNELQEQKKQTSVSEQRAADYAKRLKEVEKEFLQSEKGMERAITEKTMLEKQMLELQERFNRLEQQYTTAASKQHQAELELATFKAKQKREVTN